MLRDELMMLAGVVTDDVNYVGYMLLKDGTYFESKVVVEEQKTVDEVINLNSWFNTL